MRVTKRQLRRLIREAMEQPSVDSPGVLSVRLLSGGAAYFIAGQQVDRKTHQMLDVWDDNTGEKDVPAYEAAMRQLGITHVLDQNFQEMGKPDLYRPLPIDEYMNHASSLFG